MPIIKSAKKQMRQNKKNQAKNLKNKKLMKKSIKNMDTLIKSKKADEAKAELPKTFSVIDSCEKKNILHKNNAARKKARLNKLVNNLTKPAQSAE